jgi:hypothetical protein
VRTPRLSLPARIALGAGLFVFGGLIALWDLATEKREPPDYGPKW